MRFKVISEIRGVETIGRGLGVDARRFLNMTYGQGRWRKMKGVAEVEYSNGEIWLVEIHWYEAHGIGRRREKDKRRIRRIA
ncbi:MAG: hypothetical protein KJZ93_08255 [Caldilineaceae bacterium]|nr:hypothetical protein [Caldilineaceae bacterium]